MNKNIEKALEIFKTLDKNTPVGHYEVSEMLYYNIEEYTTDLEEKRRFEMHRHYADIQCILEGEEIIWVADPSELDLEEEFMEERDAAFYRGDRIGTSHHLKAGDYLILYPGEAHKPGVCVGKPSPTKKVVFKVKIEE